MSVAHQVSLFGGGAASADSRFRGLLRYELPHGAWVDHLPGWLSGHEAVFEAVRRSTDWRAGRRQMYDRVVDVPRLTARFPEDGPGHPVLAELSDALTDRYDRELRSLSAALYRSGRDSVAWHGDRLGELRADSVVAIVSVGEPRRFLLRPATGGASRAFRLGWGDLLVMGGSCQATWEHSVPKVASAGPRISLMFRPFLPG